MISKEEMDKQFDYLIHNLNSSNDLECLKVIINGYYEALGREKDLIIKSQMLAIGIFHEVEELMNYLKLNDHKSKGENND